jgi:glycerophosphoryl diester phosphodiesterase
MKFAFCAPVAVAAAMIVALCPAHATDTADIMRRIRDPRGGIVVVAHRGCHEAAPRHRLPTAPENSRAALEHCVALGVDIMETDVRKTRDGYLVMMHDDRVDRTTDGKGEVAQMTLAELKALHLKENEGGPTAASTAEVVLTLDEILALAKGRIVLNLDIKDMIYPEVIAATERAGMQDRVIVKTTAGVGSAVLASMTPYDRVPFAVIPTTGDPQAADLPSVIGRQGAGRIKPVAFELPYIPSASLAPIAQQASAMRIRLWVNTLWTGFVVGAGGDLDALRDPDAVWGALARNGVTMFQTDEPEALLRYRDAGGAPSAKRLKP